MISTPESQRSQLADVRGPIVSRSMGAVRLAMTPSTRGGPAPVIGIDQGVQQPKTYRD
jgi:hypothetical protein